MGSIYTKPSNGVPKLTIGYMRFKLQEEILFGNQQRAYKLIVNLWD